MSFSLAIKLISFSLSNKSFKEKFKYLLLSIIFYFFLLKDVSLIKKNTSEGLGSPTGDDIYPLF